MDLQEFFAEKKRTHIRLVKDLLAGKHADQPPAEDWPNPETDEIEKRPVCVYLTSVRKREAGTVAGHVCLVEIWNQQDKPGLASERIADGTHRVSTPEEIRAYLKRQIDQKVMHDAADVKNNIKRMQIVGADTVSGLPDHLRSLAAEKPAPQPAGKK